jgi:hypothetical protein
VQIDEGESLPDWREFAGIVAMVGPMGAYPDTPTLGTSGWCVTSLSLPATERPPCSRADAPQHGLIAGGAVGNAGHAPER